MAEVNRPTIITRPPATVAWRILVVPRGLAMARISDFVAEVQWPLVPLAALTNYNKRSHRGDASGIDDIDGSSSIGPRVNEAVARFPHLQGRPRAPQAICDSLRDV